MINIKIFFIFYNIFLFNNFSYAALAIKFFNFSGKEIEYLQLTYEHTSYKLLNNNLNSNKSIYLNSLGEIEVDRKFNIKVVDTHKKCHYIDLLKNKIPNGWELELYINSANYGKICATKLFLLDPYVHASLEYFVTESHYNFKFHNTGVSHNNYESLNIFLENILYN